jgi:hypothetical protein
MRDVRTGATKRSRGWRPLIGVGAALAWLLFGCTVDDYCVEDTAGCAPSCPAMCGQRVFLCGTDYNGCLAACASFSEPLRVCLDNTESCGADCASLGFDGGI